MAWEEISSRRNPLLSHIRKLLASRSYRQEQGEYVCDGEKLLEEALRWKAEIPALLCTEPERLPPLPEQTRLLRLPRDVMASVSPMEAPQGVLFLVRQRPAPLPARLEGRRYLALEGVQDPGNVGTVLRSADAFDCDGLFLLEGCADLYNFKTVRAAMGAQFRRPVWTCSLPELTRLLQESGLPLYGAALREDTEDLRQLSPGRAVFAVGSEGRGLSQTLLRHCRATVKIPMSRRCESLNAAVAASVLLWEMYRREEGLPEER